MEKDCKIIESENHHHTLCLHFGICTYTRGICTEYTTPNSRFQSSKSKADAVNGGYGLMMGNKWVANG